MQIAQFINLILLTLVTGVFWGTWFSLSRTMESTTPSTFLEVGKMMIVNLGGPMSILMPLALLSTLPVLYFLYRQRRTRDLVLVLLGFLCFIVALVGTLAVNVPIDRQINAWTLATLPADWMQLRDRWEVWHTIRTFASLVGLACVLASALHLPDLARSGSPQSQRPPERFGSSSGYDRTSARRA
jgi:hypothetical protein